MDCLQKWVRLVVSAPDAEERAYELLNLGASGIEAISESTIAASFLQDPRALGQLQKQIIALGFSISSSHEIKEENWVQKCEEFFVPVSVGKLRVTPVLDSESCPKPAPLELFVVPGFGFGTGHHPSTRMILSLMQSPPLPSITTIADIGTGSGILSAAAALLYPAASILAVDNDEQALISARTTMKMNPALSCQITLELGSFEQLRGPYDLLVANLYEEVFRQGASQITSSARSPGGTLIVSGLFATQESTLDELFPPFAWTITERLEEDGWIARRYTRR